MIKRRPRAIYAIIDLAEYIGRDSPQSAERFFDAIESTFQQLEAMPGMGHRYESADNRLTELRVWSVKGFPNHLIFYNPLPNGIEVVHVLHGARDLDSALADELKP